MPYQFNKIQLHNQSKNRQIGIVQKSLQPLNDKPQLSAPQNINAKIMIVQNDGGVFTLAFVKTK